MKTNRHFHLPSMTWLLAFEAAARCMSFKEAAIELGVTPASVSQNIKRLEEELQNALFTRNHRSVTLTDAGQELFGALETGFSTIAQTIEMLRCPVGEQPVKIGALVALSSYWLMPRIAGFLSQHAWVNIHQISSNYGHELAASDLDLRLQYGKSNVHETDQCTQLFKGRIIPVASPEFAAKHPVSDIDSLLRLPLIHMDVPTSWLTWPQWFAHFGITHKSTRGPKANNYILTLEMAANGAGIALGWDATIHPLLKSKRLVPLTPLSIPSPEAFYLVRHPKKQSASSVQLLHDWLVDSANSVNLPNH